MRRLSRGGCRCLAIGALAQPGWAAASWGEGAQDPFPSVQPCHTPDGASAQQVRLGRLPAAGLASPYAGRAAKLTHQAPAPARQSTQLLHVTAALGPHGVFRRQGREDPALINSGDSACQRTSLGLPRPGREHRCMKSLLSRLHTGKQHGTCQQRSADPAAEALRAQAPELGRCAACPAGACHSGRGSASVPGLCGRGRGEAVSSPSQLTLEAHVEPLCGLSTLAVSSCVRARLQVGECQAPMPARSASLLLQCAVRRCPRTVLLL